MTQIWQHLGNAADRSTHQPNVDGIGLGLGPDRRNNSPSLLTIVIQLPNTSVDVEDQAGEGCSTAF